MNELLGFFFFMLSFAVAVALNVAAVVAAISITNSLGGLAVLILTLPLSTVPVMAVMEKVA